MNWLAPLLMLCIPFSLTGQSKTSIDLVVGLENSFRNFSSTEVDGGRFQPISDNGKDAKDSPRLTYRFGFNLNQRLGDGDFYLKTGLRYSYNNYVTNLSGLRWGTEFDPGSGTIVDDPNRIEIHNRNSFFELPIAIRKNLTDNKIQPFVELGCSTLLHWDKLGFSNTSAIPNKLRSLHFLGSLSFGIHYEMKESVKLFLQPIFRYHLTHLGDEAFSEHLYNYGAEVGLRKAI